MIPRESLIAGKPQISHVGERHTFWSDGLSTIITQDVLVDGRLPPEFHNAELLIAMPGVDLGVIGGLHAILAAARKPALMILPPGEFPAPYVGADRHERHVFIDGDAHPVWTYGLEGDLEGVVDGVGLPFLMDHLFMRYARIGDVWCMDERVIRRAYRRKRHFVAAAPHEAGADCLIRSLHTGKWNPPPKAAAMPLVYPAKPRGYRGRTYGKGV